MGEAGKAFGDRFWARVDRAGECWVWRGVVNPKGRGVVSIAGPTVDGARERTSMPAHRLAWILSRGRDPGAADVVQTCGNALCCRPKHLALRQR